MEILNGHLIMLKVLFFLFIFSINVNAQVIKEDINYSVASVHINGTVDVELYDNSDISHFEVSYQTHQNGIINITHENGVFYIQSDGVFDLKPKLKISIKSSISEYITEGISNSILYINGSDNVLNMVLQGISKVKLIGHNDILLFKLSGTSNLDIVDYTAKKITGSLNGISSLNAKKSTELSVQRMGISKVYYQ